MIIKSTYSNYIKRIFSALSNVLIISTFWTIFIFMGDFHLVGKEMSLMLYGVITLPFLVLSFNRTKTYLTSIKIENNICEIESNTFNRKNENIITPISEIKIVISEMPFSFTKWGRNYKLIIETKQGLKYKKLFEQYEIGSWNLDKFKSVLDLYGQIKGVPISTAE